MKADQCESVTNMTSWTKASVAMVLLVLAATVGCLQGLASRSLAAEMGTISGIVVDEKTGEPLIGASVLIEGTSIGASCDLDGHFTIRAVPEGTHSLLVSSIGYAPKRLSNLKISESEPLNLRFALVAKEIQLKSIEVMGRRKGRSESATLLRRRDAPNVTDNLSVESLSRSGDGDAGDALKRVVGVSVVDGRHLVVRGMGGRYSNVRLDGIPLPSPEPEKREVPLDLFPTGSLEEVVTSKTFTPDQPANFSGGSVNLLTREIPGSFTYGFSASATYNSETTGKLSPSYSGGGTDWLGVDDGTRDRPAEMANPEWFDSSNPSNSDPDQQRAVGQAFKNQWTPTNTHTPVNSSYSLKLGNRLPLGGGKVLGLSGTLSYTNSHSRRAGEIYREWNNDTIPFADYSNIQRGTQSVLWGGLFNTTLKLSDNHQFAFKSMLNRTADDEAFMAEGFDGYHGHGILETHLDFISRWMGVARLSGEHTLPGLFGSKVEWQAAVSGAGRDQPDYRSALYAVYETPDGERIQQFFESGYSFSRIYTELDDEGGQFALDYTIPFDKNGSNVKVGGLYDAKTRLFQANRYRYVRNRTAPDDGFAEDMLVTENIGSAAREDRGKWYLIDNTFAEDGYDANDHLTAGYLMLNIPVLPRVRFVGGARYEDSDLRMLTGTRSGDTVIALHTTDWLPMASAVLSLGDKMNLRGVVSRTMARPEFRELAPFTFQDYGLGTPTRGNPALRPTYVVNYDLRLELFPDIGEVIAVSAFAKTFTDPIEIYVIESATRETYHYQNVEEATTYGAEFELRKELGFVSRSLTQFMFGANVTLMRSEVHINDPAGGGLFQIQRPLMGQSPYTINLVLGYTSVSGNTNATLLYNSFGDRLDRLTTITQEPFYEETRHQLDLTFSQKIWDVVTLKLGAKNLLDEAYHVTQEQAHGVTGTVEYYKKGRSLSFGAGYGI